MKTSRFRASVLVSIAVPSAALLVLGQLSGCGGDDATGQASPLDASTDSTAVVDGTSPGDGATDGGADTSSHQDAEAGSETDDGGDAATCAVTVPTEAEFFSALVSAECQSLKTCCNIGSNFDTAACFSTYGNATFGGFLGTAFPVNYLDGGRIAYDPSAACRCLEAVTSLSCGLVTSDALAAMQASCLAALHGTVPIANVGDAGNANDAGDPGDASDGGDAGDAGDAGPSGCASSYECASGYCTVTYATDPVDAALGVCAPLVADGGACTSQFQCSYLSNGSPSLDCSGTSHTCVPRIPAGSACQTSSQCSSNLCQGGADGGPPTCVSGGVIGSAGLCSAFTLPEAGPDGGDGG
jgi:hypothetical protein